MRPKDQDDVSIYNSTTQNYQFYLSCLQFQLIKQHGEQSKRLLIITIVIIIILKIVINSFFAMILNV